MIELAVEGVALDCSETPEEYEKASNWTKNEKDLPGSVLIRVNQNLYVYYDYNCCEYKIPV
jgi:hypothetical protein